MKNFVKYTAPAILTVLVCLYASSASAQDATKQDATPKHEQTWSGFVEAEGDFNTPSNFGQINFELDGSPFKNKKFGVSTWALLNKSYSELYEVGTYSPKPWLQLALGAGVEQAAPAWRLGGWVFAKKNRWSNFFAYEQGGSGWWHKDVANFQATKQVGFGFASQMYRGNGPHIQWSIPKSSMELHFNTYLSQTKSPNYQLDLRWKF